MVEPAYFVPAEERKIELIVVNSRFISIVSPVFSIEDAKEFINHIRHEYRDASHHVPAYIIGSGASTIMHCNDDGEPSGTAGRPILAVLKGSKFGDIALVVTRYFGGTKLGTGGLVRAYTEAAQNVLVGMPRAKRILVYKTFFSVTYSHLERIRRLIQFHQGDVQNEVFASEVSFSASFPVEKFDSFKIGFLELTNGQGEITIKSTEYSLLKVE